MFVYNLDGYLIYCLHLYKGSSLHTDTPLAMQNDKLLEEAKLLGSSFGSIDWTIASSTDFWLESIFPDRSGLILAMVFSIDNAQFFNSSSALEGSVILNGTS